MLGVPLPSSGQHCAAAPTWQLAARAGRCAACRCECLLILILHLLTAAALVAISSNESGSSEEVEDEDERCMRRCCCNVMSAAPHAPQCSHAGATSI